MRLREHRLSRHVGAWLWIHCTSSKLRWSFIRWMNRDPDRRDWCDLADCALSADRWDDEDRGSYRSRGRRHDYREPWACLCDFPLPWDAKPPNYGHCYCPTPEERAAMAEGGA